MKHIGRARNRGAKLLLALAFTLQAGLAAAQAFPARPIKIITPFAVGGASDIVARVIGERMAASLGQPVIVENRAGAGGAIGMDAVANADPDGYTIGLTTASALVVLPLAKPSLTYPQRLIPLGYICNVPLVLAARANLKANTLRDLVTLAKAQPGQLKYGSSGTGGLQHVLGEKLKDVARVDLLHVPYKGDAQLIPALLAEEIDVAFVTAAVATTIKSGRVKGLAIVGTQRIPELPDVPTPAEAGLPELGVDSFYGLVVATRTPQPIVDKLADAMIAAVKAPEVQNRLRSLSLIPVGRGSDAFTQVIRENRDAWSKVIGKMDLKE
ncbi:MAG: Bug family tripartite tricarboxylate transporter substrate binding protein [Lautropia sp.]